MGYTSRQKFYEKCYVPTADLYFSNDAERSSVTVGYIKLKEITLVAPIVAQSLFRFKFDMHCSFGGGTNVHGRIYRNGVAVGTIWTMNSATYTTYTEDIVTTNWKVLDTIELWVSCDNAGNGVLVRNFRLYGIGSEFVNTLGM